MNSLGWTGQMVSNAADVEAAAIRNYWEHRLVREATAMAAARVPIRVAFDVGAGYGRMARVLAEFAAQVTAFERDPTLLAKGRLLNPDIRFVPVRTLAPLPAESRAGEFALTFTVLQHLTDATCMAVIQEVKRILRHGHVLLVEETAETPAQPDLPHDETSGCRHRSVARYEAAMAPLRLIQTWPRRIEPTYPFPDVGTAMLFATDA
jgi:SAM-dependent methyltransferase